MFSIKIMNISCARMIQKSMKENITIVVIPVLCLPLEREWLPTVHLFLSGDLLKQNLFNSYLVWFSLSRVNTSVHVCMCVCASITRLRQRIIWVQIVWMKPNYITLCYICFTHTSKARGALFQVTFTARSHAVVVNICKFESIELSNTQNINTNTCAIKEEKLEE